MDDLEKLVINQALGDREQGVEIAIFDNVQAEQNSLVEDGVGEWLTGVIEGGFQGCDVHVDAAGRPVGQCCSVER